MKSFKKILATVLCVIMVFGSAPLSGLIGLELPEFNLFTPKASAATYSGTCGDNLTWSLDTSTGELIINGSGEMYDWTSYSSVPWSSYLSYIKTVKISDSVTSIGRFAFYDCDGLTSITIPDSVISIGNSAFYRCTGLTSITIPDSVTSIGKDAFYKCTGLTSITIPDSVTSIGDGVFCSCTGLTSITIPDNVTSIGDQAFSGCTGLTSITIPDSVTSIGDQAFYRCTVLTSITIPDSVTSIGKYAFYNTAFCNNSANWDGRVLYIDGWLIDTKIPLSGATIIKDGTRGIAEHAFAYNTGLTSITIPDSVTSIGDGTFYGCTGLTSITIPDSVTSIGVDAFRECTKLTSITIPDSVTSIGKEAFYRCDNLKDVYYNGSGKEWEKIEIAPNNAYLLNAYLHFAYHYITWVVDGEETTERIAVGDTVNIPGNPSKDYYTFSGWDKQAPATMPEKDYVITAKFTPITYNATFVIDGETFATVPYTVETESIENPVLPKRDGYTEIWEDYTLTPGGITVDAIYSINSHTVTWIVDGKKTVDTYNYGDTVVKPADPKKVGYTFAGWGAEIPATVPDKDLTFTANWKVNNYTVTWNVDGVTTTETYNYGESINKPTNPVKEGYTFIGWNNDVPSTMPANNLELVAEWSINPHTVTWIVDGKKTVDTYNYGDTIVKPADPEKVGYTFNGWGAEIPATVPDKDLTFTANWKVNNYTVTWNVDGVTTIETYNYGESINKPANPVKEGYTFIGWNNNVPSTMPAETLEFVAEWAINPHTVTWIVDGKKTVDIYNYGDTIVKPADPEKVGYTFNGWGTEIPVTVPDKDLTFTANWKVNNYTVIWNVDGVITEEYYDYGAEITAPVPEKDGYFFIGWDKVVPDTMPAESLEFVAQWSKVEYEFEFDGNGIIINSAINASGDVEIPATINGYPVIAIDEYAFAGSDVTSVTIPEGVESIGWFAFGCCDKLETVNIPSSVTDIDYGAFSGCSNIETINISADNNNFVTDEYGVVYTEGFIDLVYAPAKSVGEAYAMRSTATYIYPFAFSDCSDFALTISDNLSDEDADEFLLYISVNEFITNDSCINFKAVDGVLYNKAVTKLYKYPVDNKREFYALPSSVTTIADEFAFVCVDKAFYLFVDEDIIMAGVDEIFKTPENLTLHIDYASEFTVDHFTMTLFGPAHVCVGDITKADADALNENAEEIIAELEKIWDEIEPELTPGTDEYDFMKAYVLGYIDMITNYVDCENDHTRLHKYAAVVEKDEGNCTNDGCTNYKCVCGYEFTEAITAPGHNYVAVVTAPTCTKAGYTTYTCSACGDSYVDDEVSATGHSHESKVTKEPTCTQKGVKTFTCHCGDTYTESIKANGHTPGEWQYGSGNIYVKLCSVCGESVESKYVNITIKQYGISTDKITLKNKSTDSITAVVTDNFTDDIIFTSSNENVVSVDENGKIVANDVGTATVSVKIRGTNIIDTLQVEVLPREFKITWNVNGRQTTYIVKEYEEINSYTDTGRQGYRFIGWDSEVPETMPSENLSFTAQYECISTVSIKNNSGSKTINYGETLKLTANAFDMPAGAKICWYVDGVKRGEGENFEITFESGSKTVEVKLVDANGNVLKNGSGNEISDSETVTVKAGFFQKLAAFFKKLFGISQIIVQSINF